MSRAFKLKAPNRQPERDLQRAVAEDLRAYLPGEVWWTASLSGVRLSPGVASDAKKAGMEKGAPDLSFVWPDGETTYVELKAGDGTLTAEQKRLQATLGSRFAVCRSKAEVRAVLAPRLAAAGLRFLTDTESWQREGLRRARAA